MTRDEELVKAAENFANQRGDQLSPLWAVRKRSYMEGWTAKLDKDREAMKVMIEALEYMCVGRWSSQNEYFLIAKEALAAVRALGIVEEK